MAANIYHLSHYGARHGVLQWREIHGDRPSGGWSAVKLWNDPVKKVAVYEIQVPLAWEPVTCT